MAGLKKTHESFLLEVKDILVNTTFLDEYSGAKIPLRVQCNNGHTRTITPTNLLSRGSGIRCLECEGGQLFNNAKKWSNKELEYLAEHYKDTPTKDMQEYLGRSYAAIANKCKELGYIKEIKASNSLTLEEVNKRIKNLYPDLEVLRYGLAAGESTIRGSCGHTWEAKTNNILSQHSGFLCSICNPTGVSKEEKDLVDFIKANYSGWLIENDRQCIPPLELDLVLPDLGIAIEYNGVYFHSDRFKSKTYHIDKTKMLWDNMEYRLIHINSDEWLTKPNIVKSRLLSLLGKTTKIHARKCIVKEIPFPKTFLLENHIQGAGSITSINLGLYYHEALVSVMTFSKPRFTSHQDYELVRYCSILNHTVVGGASKLFKYFRNKYPGSVVSYSDKRWSMGNLYKTLGFSFSHYSQPNYKYYKGNISYSRYQCQKHKLKDLFPDIYADNKTESSIMEEAGFYKVYDCGSDVWIIT